MRNIDSWNRRLALAAVALCLLSAWTYWNDQRRSDRFQSGQKLLQSLDPDRVARIELRDGADAGRTLTLTRDDDRFVIVENGGYRARNEELNRLLKDLVDLELERRVGTGEQVAEEAAIEPKTTESNEVALFDDAGEEMLRLRFGKSAESGAGRFVRRQDGDDRAIYLTKGSATFAADADRFLDKEIVDHPSTDVSRIEGVDFVLAREGDGPLQLMTPKRPAKSSEVSKLSSFLNRLRFEKAFLADAPDVSDLQFVQSLRIDLDDDSGYIVSSARRGDETFVRIIGLFSIDRVEVGLEESDEQLQEKADVLKRSDAINQFNAYHGSWVYSLASYDAEKLSLKAADLVE